MYGASACMELAARWQGKMQVLIDQHDMMSVTLLCL